MSYEKVLKILLLHFPELSEKYNENDYLQELPHCFFDMIFVPYIVKACKEEKNIILNKVGDFLENMALSKDEKVRELLNVSVLEPLVLEGEVINILQKYLKKLTLQELLYWKNFYM